MEIDMAEPTAIRQPSEIPARPKMVIVIGHLDNAQANMNEAVQVLFSMIKDLEKGSDWIGSFRDSFIRTLEQVGGDVGAAVEGQIREYIGNKYRAPENNGNAGSREST
jgi:hypothetical protein